jgi:hypothetical protein
MISREVAKLLTRKEVANLFIENYAANSNRKKTKAAQFRKQLLKGVKPVGTIEQNCLPEKSCTVCEKEVCIFDKKELKKPVDTKPVWALSARRFIEEFGDGDIVFDHNE